MAKDRTRGHRPPTTRDEELLEAETFAIESELDDKARIARISAEFDMGFRAMDRVGKAVSIYGSARTGKDDPVYKMAHDVSQAIGEAGFAIITGGGPGVMEAAAHGARDAGVLSVGLGIELPHEQSMSEHLDISLEFNYFFARKVMFVRYASAFVALPGGFGTLDEVFEVATLRQTEKIKYFPVILFGSEYWGGLVDWLKDSVHTSGNISADDVKSIEVTDSIDRVLELIEQADSRRPRA